MRICLSVLNLSGENLRISRHFGETGNFVLIDSETGQDTVYPASALPCRGPCACRIPLRQDDAYDAVICQAIGPRELAEMRRKGIPVYLTMETTPEEALQRWRENRLVPVQRGRCLKNRRNAAQLKP